MSSSTLLLERRQGVRRALSVAWLLASREWLAEYRKSKLSVVWPILHPLGYTMLFVLLRSTLAPSGRDPVAFALWVFIGFSLWQGWIDILRAQLSGIRRHKGLMSRGELDMGTLALATAMGVALQAAPRIGLATIAAAILLPGPASAYVALAPFTLLLLANGAVLGGFLQPFATLSPDFDRSLQSLSLALLVTGGVFVALPLSGDGPMRMLALLNPVGPLLSAARSPLFGEPMLSPAGAITWTLVTVAGAVALPFLGRRLLPLVVERMGN